MQLSVIIPFYNAHEFISDCLESLQKQSFQNFKILICDDGSVPPFDETHYDKFGFGERLQVFRNDINTGAGAARNILLKKIKTPYLAFQDADDISTPERFEKQIQFLIENPEAAGVGTSISLTDSNLNHIREEIYPKQTMRNNSFHGCCATYMLRSSILNEATKYPEEHGNLGEDLAFFQSLNSDDKLYNLEQILYKYRSHPNQNTQKPNYRYGLIMFLAAQQGIIDQKLFETISKIDDIEDLKEKTYAAIFPFLRKIDRLDVGRALARTLISDMKCGNLELILGIAMLTKIPRSTFEALRNWAKDAIGRRLK